MFVDDFYEWVERLAKKWDRKKTISILKEINMVKRMLEDKLNRGA